MGTPISWLTLLSTTCLKPFQLPWSSLQTIGNWYINMMALVSWDTYSGSKLYSWTTSYWWWCNSVVRKMAALRRFICGDICWSWMLCPSTDFFQWHKKPSENCSMKNLCFRLLMAPVHILKTMLIEKCVFISVYYWILPKKKRLFQCPKYLILYYSGFLVLNADCLNDDVKADAMYSRQDCFLHELILKGSYLLCCFCIPYRGFGKNIPTKL